MSLRGLALAGCFWVFACGSRSGIHDCFSDDDCKLRDLCTTQRCVANTCVIVARTVCDDGDPCTDDRCDKKSGTCVFDPRTLDLDGDGHHIPLVGFAPGAPGSCGDDCDDTDPAAHPGAAEVCDGVDNDCNGIVDDGARYVPGPFGSELRVSAPDDDYAESSSLARGGNDLTLGVYLATKYGQVQPFVLTLDDAGGARSPAKVLGSMPAAGGSATIAWTGDRYGVAWSDRRDGNYEIYFAAFDGNGNKVMPGDERITISDGFSLYPSLVWTGESFIVIWQEEAGNTQGWRLQAQKIGLDGRLLGDIVTLTPSASFEQAPSAVATRTEIGVAWVRGDGASQRVFFGTWDFDLKPKTAMRDISGAAGGRNAVLASVKNAYVAAWYTPAATTRAVFATSIAPDGEVLVGPVRVSDGASGQSRDPALLSLGDRVLLVWADDRDKNQGYELYTRTLGADLVPLGPSARITNAMGDSIEPVLAFGHKGSVSVLFRDDRLAAPAAFFTALACSK